jgi:hypothetical protein
MRSSSEGLGEEASVHDDKAKVGEDVNDAEQKSLLMVRLDIAQSSESAEETHIFAFHCEVRAILVTRNWMSLPSLNDEVEEVTRRTNLVQGECLDSEEAYDNGDDKSVKVVRQKCRLDTTDEGI